MLSRLTTQLVHARAAYNLRPRWTSSVAFYACILLVALVLTLSPRMERVQQVTISAHHYIHRITNSQASVPNSWASTGPLSESAFPAPYEDYRFTHFHSALRKQSDTYREGEGRFVSVMGYIELTTVGAFDWQTRSAKAEFIDHIDCTFTLPLSRRVAPSGYASLASTPDAGNWLYTINCPIPEELEEVLKTRHDVLQLDLDFTLKEEGKHFLHMVTLSPKFLEPVQPGSVGICLAPIWGHIPALATLEWRLHHHNLGVDTVHWYARDPSIKQFVEAYNAATGSRDTFVFATPISRDHRTKVPPDGFYQDQVLYYQDCKIRSIHEYPTEYLAYVDRDEHFWPTYLITPRPSWTPRSVNLSHVPLHDFFSTFFAELTTLEPEMGSACFSRTMKTGPVIPLDDLVEPSISETLPTELAYFSRTLGGTAPMGKCVNNVNRVDVATVHAGAVFYPGFHNVDIPPSEVFLSHTVGHGWYGTVHMNVPEALRHYLAGLWVRREEVKALMGWGCDTLPCKYDP